MQNLASRLEEFNVIIEDHHEAISQLRNDAQFLDASSGNDVRTDRRSRTYAFCSSRSPSTSAQAKLSPQDSRSICDVLRNLDRYDGTPRSKARTWLHTLQEAVRGLQMLQLQPTEQVETFFVSQMSMKFRASTQTWFQQYKQTHPDLRYRELEAAFRTHFIATHEVALAARARFWNLHDKARTSNMSVTVVYQTMLSCLDEIQGNDPPAVSDQTMQFFKCISDEYIRAEARRLNP